MSELIAFTQVSPPLRMRNEHWQRRFSEHFALIEKLREFAVEPDGAESLVAEVCEAFEVPMPEFAFNRRRKAHNGLYELPRSHKLMWSGGERLAALEKERGKPFSEAGVIRLGNPVSVGTVAHYRANKAPECSHCLTVCSCADIQDAHQCPDRLRDVVDIREGS